MSKNDKRALRSELNKLCRRFYDDAQALFDDPRMTDAIYDSEAFENLAAAQACAEDALNSETGG
jgi:hypothetical protein